jgi:hypothetical protein
MYCRELRWVTMTEHNPDYQISHRGHVRLMVARKGVPAGYHLAPKMIKRLYYYTLQDSRGKQCRVRPRAAVTMYHPGARPLLEDAQWAKNMRSYATYRNGQLDSAAGEDVLILYKGGSRSIFREIGRPYAELRVLGTDVCGSDPEFCPFPPPPEEYLCCREPLMLMDDNTVRPLEIAKGE